jgi:AcrR family transcriptional regulator
VTGGGATATLGRRERRRRSTRAALAGAARTVLADKGIDALTVAEVTGTADVGFGTFYGYFASKDELIGVVVDDVLAEIGDRNDELTAGLQDPALVVAVGVRNTLRTALQSPELASVMVRLFFSGDSRLWEGLQERMVRDLDRGVAAGRFRPDRRAVAPLVIAGTVMAALRARNQGKKRSDVADLERSTAEAILGALGLSAGEAARLAVRAGTFLER